MTQRDIRIPNGFATVSSADAQLIWNDKVVDIEMHNYCGVMFCYAEDGSEFVPAKKEEDEVYYLATKALRYAAAERALAHYNTIKNTVADIMQAGLGISTGARDKKGNPEAGMVTLNKDTFREELEWIVASAIKDRNYVTTYQYATKRLLDSVWTIIYLPLEGSNVELMRHTRDSNLGYHVEDIVPKGNIEEHRTESCSRLAAFVKVHGLALEIENKKHVFNY